MAVGEDGLVEYGESDSSTVDLERAKQETEQSAEPAPSSLAVNPDDQIAATVVNREGTQSDNQDGNPAESDQASGVDPDLLNKINRFKALRQQGIFFNDNLINSKSYRNPHIYAKLFQFLNVEECGTNFDRSVWDPLGFPKEAYADSLREQQQRASDEKQYKKSNGKRTMIEFEKPTNHRQPTHDGSIEGAEYRERGRKERERRRDRSRSPRRR